MIYNSQSCSQSIHVHNGYITTRAHIGAHVDAHVDVYLDA